MNPSTCRFLATALALLLSARWQGEACSCGPTHPQQSFCQADVVIKGKVISSRVVSLGNGSDANPSQWAQYQVEQHKMYKGFEKVERVREVYTPLGDFVCGVMLGPGQMDEEYVLSGNVHSDGNIYINICSLNRAWKELTPAQRVFLDGSYEAGCQCTVSLCVWLPCNAKDNQCLWTDGMLNGSWDGVQSQRFSCTMNSSGLCRWVSTKVARMRALSWRDRQ